ncbi:D-inositol-3-phosphate glycosyltransferase [Candidatus Burarchaeum australiense]|nr:D-inositol-3-phosphate glycosyltransferase [Candidatus Burarchaeum australiense]
MRVLSNTAFSPQGGIGRQKDAWRKFANDASPVHPGLSLALIGPALEAGKSVDGNVSTRFYQVNEGIFTGAYGGLENVRQFHERFEPIVEDMRRLIGEEQPDCALIGGTYWFPWVIMKAAEREGIPIIHSYQGILSQEIVHYPEPLKQLLHEIERDFFDESRAYIFPSTLAKNTVHALAGSEFPRSYVVFNGVPPEIFSLPENRDPAREFSIGFVGRWDPIKNFKYLGNLSSATGLPVRAVMTPKDAEIAAQMTAAGVVFVPPMSQEDIVKFYQTVGVMVSPSRFETYGNVPLEAVATGTPAVITSTMGVAEVFGQLGLQRFIVDIAGFENGEVAEKIQAIHKNGERIEESVIERIKDAFAWPKMLQKFVIICKEYVDSFKEKVPALVG